MKRLFLILLTFILFISCKKDTQANYVDPKDIFKAPISTEKLPDDLVWLTNDTDPTFADTEAKKGGIYHYRIPSFPLTFRNIGPDSNNYFRDYLDKINFYLISEHPNTDNLIPELATHWAYSKDKKTMYFKLNKDAKWSDGVPVTAHDYAFTVEFMRSKEIVSPWHNDYYSKEIDKIIVYDDYTLAVVATKAVPDLFLTDNIGPTPRHFYGKLSNDFIRKYNWKITPVTGPYQISDFKKGKYVKFSRIKNWWGEDLRYFKNRFNVDHIYLDVISDTDISWEYFKKGKLDDFPLNYPEFWYDKAKGELFDKGYIHKIWFFNDIRQPSSGLFINQGKEIFQDKNVRLAFAYAMNIDKVIQKVLRNNYYRLDSGYVGYGKYSNTNIKARNYDIEKVEHYMIKSGWKRGSDGIWIKNNIRYSVEVVYNNDAHTPRLVVLKEEAKKAGIELTLLKLDAESSYKKIMEKKHDVAWMGWSTSYRPVFWEHYHSSNAYKPNTNNITNTADKELDKLIDAERATLDENEKIRLSKLIQQKVDDLCVYIPTYMVPYTREAFWRWWRLPKIPGTKKSEAIVDPFAGLCWFDEDLYKETQNAMKTGKTFPPVTIIDKTYKMDILK